MKSNRSIPKTAKEIYNDILVLISTLSKHDSEKLVHYLHDEKGYSIRKISKILGTSHQAVHEKYFSYRKQQRGASL